MIKSELVVINQCHEGTLLIRVGDIVKVRANNSSILVGPTGDYNTNQIAGRVVCIDERKITIDSSIEYSSCVQEVLLVHLAYIEVVKEGKRND